MAKLYVMFSRIFLFVHYDSVFAFIISSIHLFMKRKFYKHVVLYDSSSKSLFGQEAKTGWCPAVCFFFAKEVEANTSVPLN